MPCLPRHAQLKAYLGAHGQESARIEPRHAMMVMG